MTPVKSAGSDPHLAWFDPFTLDLARRALYRHGERIHLTVKPLDTLVELVSRAGETVSKQELMDAVWKNTAVTEDVLVQAVGEIRRALGEKPGEDRFVQTVPRHGYRFVMPVTRIPATPGGAVASAFPRERQNRAPRTLLEIMPLVIAAVVLAGAAWIGMNGWKPAAGAPRAGPADLDPLAAISPRLNDVSSYATINAGGVIAEIDGDTNRNAEVWLEWRLAGGPFRRGHPLVRIDDRHFVGSLFWLAEDTAYEAKVTLHDPDGVSGRASAAVALRTQRDTWPEPTLGTLHVSPAGRDTNSGASPEVALRTIQRAADLAKAGDVVLIHPGVYRESVRVGTSGTWMQPIVFRGAGPGVILDGSDERMAAGVPWQAIGEGVYTADRTSETRHVATERGRLFRYRSLDDLRALRAGAPGGFFADEHRLYLKFADGSPPAVHAIHAGRLDRGFVLEKQSWIAVENLTFRYFGGAADGIAVFMKDCAACRVYRCRIQEVGRAGVWVEGGERGRIEDNEIWDTSINRWAWHDASASSADTHGIFFTGPSPRGHIVRRNRIRGTFDAVAPCGAAAPAAGLTNETDVYENEFSDLADDGVEAEPYCANLRVWGNRVTAVMMAFSTAPSAPGPTWILRNIAYRFGAARGREVWLGSALKVNTFDRRSTGPLLVYHNTFLTDVPGVDGIALLDPGQVALVRARNNVIAGTRFAIFKVNPLRWDGDGNDLHTTSAGPLIEWLGTPYANLQDFRGATGQEGAGMSAAPALGDPARGDFTPRAGSPLIDRGVAIAGINDRFSGRGPDVGAIERR